jgi:hypothetical protein
MLHLPDGLRVSDARCLPIVAAYVKKLGIPQSTVNHTASTVSPSGTMKRCVRDGHVTQKSGPNATSSRIVCVSSRFGRPSERAIPLRSSQPPLPRRERVEVWVESHILEPALVTDADAWLRIVGWP